MHLPARVHFPYLYEYGLAYRLLRARAQEEGGCIRANYGEPIVLQSHGRTSLSAARCTMITATCIQQPFIDSPALVPKCASASCKLVVVVVLTLNHNTMQSVVAEAGQAPITLGWKNTSGKNKNKQRTMHMIAAEAHLHIRQTHKK